MKIQKRRDFTGFLIGSAVLYVSLLSGLIAGQHLRQNTHNTSATNTDTSNLTINVQKTIAISTTPNSVNLAFAGNTATDELKTQDLNVSVVTNNPTGYTLLMNTTTEETSLAHEIEPTYNIPSTTNTLSSPDTLQLDTWGYSKWSDGQVESPTTFSLIPNTTASHTLRTTTDILDTPNTKLTFAAYLPKNKPSGEYQRQLLFTATTNYVPQDVSLTIDTPTEDQVLPAGTTETTLQATTSLDATCKYGTTNTTYDLMPNTFTTTGTTSHSTTITGLQNETTYTYYVSCQTPNNETTTTMGRTFGVNPITTHGVMQSLTNANCPAINLDNPKAYTTFDARNNQIYYIAKIDGLCWMMSNLRYEGDGNYESGWDWNDDRYATTASNTTTTTNDDARPLTTVSGSDPSTYTDAQIADPGGSTDYTNTTAVGGFYGYLYSWCAAMGGQANACNSTSTSGFDTAVSICPAGWRLPTGGSGGEFQALNTAVNSGSKTSDAGLRTNFLAVYSGSYGDRLSGQGSNGSFWSSTAYYNAILAYNLFYSSSLANPVNYSNKYHGFAVRCVK